MPRKLLILLFVFIAIKSYSQQVALLDRSFKEPIVYTDSLTINMVEKGAFPLYVKDATKLISLISWFSKNINSYHPEAIPTQELHWGNTYLYTQNRQIGHYNNFQLVLKTTTANFSTSLIVVDANDPLPLAKDKLTKLNDYIRNNLALLQENISAKGVMLENHSN